MDAISHRIKKVVESVVENEALAEGLDEAAAEVLQGWGIKQATNVAQKTAMLDDESAEKEMYPHLKASRRLIRAIRVWVQHEAESSAEEREKLWAKVSKRATELYGEGISLPAPESFTGQTPAEFIKNLRDWLEGESKEEEIERDSKKSDKKKSFFQSLFSR